MSAFLRSTSKRLRLLSASTGSLLPLALDLSPARRTGRNVLASAARLVLACCVALLLVPAPASAQSSDSETSGSSYGALTGSITDAGTDQPLPGANVHVDGTTLGTATGPRGNFTLPDVPAGTHTVVVSFVGYKTHRQSVTVGTGETVRVGVALAGQEGVLDAVVVTGERRMRRAQETTSSVAVVSGEQIEGQQILELDDVFERTANTSTDGKIRGFSDVWGEAAGVALVIDGAVTTAGYGGGFWSDKRNSLWDVDQVEILRGPQSTKQGANAFAGAIVLRSKRPTSTWDAAARLSGASYGEMVGSAALGGPLAGDQLSFRVSADVQQRSGFIENPTDSGSDPGENDLRAFRGALRFEPNAAPNLSLLVSADHRIRRVGEPVVDVDDDPFDDELAQPLRRADETTDRYVVEAAYDLAAGLTLTSISAYNDRDFEYAGGDIRSTALTSFRALTQEVRANLSTRRVEGVAGLFYAKRDTEQPLFYRDVAFPPLAFGVSEDLAALYPDLIEFDFGSESFDKRSNVAAFGEVDVEVLPRFTVTVGGRVDHETAEANETTISDILIDLPDPDSAPSNLRDAVRNFNGALRGIAQNLDVTDDTDAVVFLPKAGLAYAFTDRHSLSVTAQRAYNSGGVSIARSGRVSRFDPEFIWNYEVALRSEWLDRRLRVNANAFYTDWSDQQVATFPTGTSVDALIVNAGRSHLRGAELSVSTVPLPGLDLYGTAGYLQTQFDEFVTGGTDYSGNEFARVPAWTGSVGGAYRHATGLFAAGELSFSDDQFVTPDNDPDATLDGLTQLDVRLGYVFPTQWTGGSTLRLTVFARNLLDNRALTAPTYFMAGGPVAQVNPPRVLGLRLDWTL